MLPLQRRSLFAAAATLLLSGCGGDSGSSAPPIAAPAPAPAPSPTPTPTPPTATARVFALGAATGRLDFNNSRDTNDGVVQGFTARDGRYFPGYANAIGNLVGQGTGGTAARDNSDRFKRAFVIDHQTATVISLVAPDYTRMVSPLTALLWDSGTDQTRLKIQLGLQQSGISSSVFRMMRDPDLASYDLVAEGESGDAERAADAARMAGAALRILAMEAAFNAINGNTAAPDTASEALGLGVSSGVDAGQLSRCLRDLPTADLIFSRQAMLPILRCRLGTLRTASGAVITLRPAVEEAIAGLIGLYTVAIGVRPEDPRERGRWLLGIRGYLIPAVVHMAAANSDASLDEVSRLATTDIVAATQRYLDHYSYNASGLFNPAPDFITMAAGSSRTIPASLLTGNDLQINGGPSGLGGLGPSSILLSISVPEANRAELSVSRSGDEIQITPAAGFRGVTWFDYLARGQFAEERMARVYIRVR
ncbi:hypothetical protein CAP39_10770 [Sphingomonas sp. IBVSS1]|nr:hypothetical protein CAP39_10770 [Sphingomonas sp. IBVSS1]